MFKLARLEITGFKSFADPTEIVFTGSGITAVVGPNGCGKSNVSDAISWVLGEQRAKSLRGGEMKDVVFAGTKNRKPGGMAEVVLHMVRDDSVEFSDEGELEGIDEALSDIDENFVDMSEIDPQDDVLDDSIIEEAVIESEQVVGETLPDADASEETVETVKALAVGSAQVVETKIKTKRHWKPRSFALDFAPGEAVSVTRRLYLSGESEYQLNGKTCRLRDIQDLFAGTGLSGSHYAIIEQGRIGQILSSKPADRRNLIEEAAGISKFRTRQRAAESRLDNAKTNLGRVTDIISEVETRVNSLRRQASKTRRFKILQEEFRILLRQLYAAEGRHLSELSHQLKLDLGKAEVLENELVEQVGAKENAAREATTASRNAEESLAELRRIHSVNALERDRAEREHIYKSEQLVGLNSRIDILKGETEVGRQRIELLTAELERLAAEDKREADALGVAETDLADAEGVHARAVAALQAIESSIDTTRAELMQHTAAFERFDEVGRQLTLNIERLEQRIGGLDAESRRAEQTFVEYERQAENLASSLAAEEKKLESLNAEKDELMAVTAASLETLRECERELGELSDEHSAKRHRLATLQELQEKRAVYTPQVQRIFAEQKEIGVTLGGVLADRLSVSERAETAVETLFGDYLQAVIVSSLDEAKKLAAWVRSNDIGRTAMLIVPEKNGSKAPASNASANSIGELLGADDELRNALSELFPREFAAELTDDLTSKTKSDMLVTPDGELLFGGRLLVTGNGSSSGQNESLLAFKRELSGLESDTSRIGKQIETARSKTESARTTLTDNEGKMVDLQSLIIKVDRGVHGMQIQLRSAKDEIDRAQRHRRVVADDIGQSSSEMAELKQKFDDAISNKTAADASRSETLAAIGEVTGRLGGSRLIVDDASTVLSEKRLVAATSSERRRSAQSALRRVENEARETGQRLSLQDLELNEAEGKVRGLHESITEITDRIANAGTEVASESDDLNNAITELAKRRAESDAMSEELAELNRRLGDARNERGAIEIRQAEAVTELKNIAENCQHELNSELADLVSNTEIAEDFVLESARPQANDLRNRLENFGAINMLALEELAEAEERFLFLETQRGDIVDSIAATEEALREIKERSRERFRTAFEAINANFSEFFTELFGGGQGQMTLLEAEDVLDAGIEVIAQPPGKRLQNIMLLSGGEKAMTAIALVMAIFKYRPSPFCLLDEVDAPLDDANVGRFAAKIAEMSEKTQFIVITHNKRTMESARAMYGVTMQEPGVSKIVSVKFE